MVGPAFCEASEDVERCQGVIKVLLPLAFPVFAATQDHDSEHAFCQEVFGLECTL